ncbi:MAG: FG-GAP-like repeat-containing protein [Planctomycetota bacterium]|jgi:hypothetical protein
MKSPACFAIVAVWLAAPAAGGEEVKQATVTPVDATVAGATVVSPDGGPLPPRGGAGAGTIPQMPGFPTSMGTQFNFKPWRGVVFADLVGDSNLEIITSSTDSKVYAWDVTGTPVPGFPVSMIGWAQYPPSVDDLDGDGDMEIVQCTRGQSSGGRLYAIDHLGQVLPGFPISVNNNNVEACPTLYDLDDDGQLEIIVGERAVSLGYLHVFEADGSEWGDNWPVLLDHVPTGTAAVGDVDDDGVAEIFYLSYLSMYLLEPDGTPLAGWPKQIPNARFSYQSAALADLDGDNDLEIVVGAHWNAAGCYVFHHDGTAFPGWPRLAGTWTFCPPTVTDLEDDGGLEILDGRAGFVSSPSTCFWAWDTTGNVKPGFPYVSSIGGGSEGPLTVADIDGDGRKEIFADFNKTAGGLGFLIGVDADGNDLPGFPLRPLGFTYLNSATIGDVDGDGDYELGVLSTQDFNVNVNLYDLPDTYQSSATDWPVYHARNPRGGLLDSGGCTGDIDGDGRVGIGDLLSLLAAWGPCPGCAEDLDGDGSVGIADLLMLLAGWGRCT